MRLAIAVGLIGAAACATVATAAAPELPAGGPATVDVRFAVFGPDRLDVLPGESVRWQNVSDRRHTVNADDGTFASGDLQAGDAFTQTFDAAGTYRYHCTVHPGMTGEVDVRHVTLGAFPGVAVAVGAPVVANGRADDPTRPIRVVRIGPAGEQTVASAAPRPDGTWTTSFPATSTGDFRAVGDLGGSGVRHLTVSDRRISLRVTRDGVVATVTPPAPYARVTLQARRRERFGWWPEQRRALDYVSEATFRLRGPVVVRVALVDRDGWTPLATSRVLRLR